ncbi:pyridoxamine 5'-phosphate oxidase family protein [Enterobacteriales bacterium SAP-6]|uniref:Pyridoxamine 5'-phosphate oxidase family protein n=2 Tax=Acerihabitans arboris TaxID=2691583 RepID=A0A845SML8_9GAMM|nr:pyridoxamine 5'-phosphate oxidase family protein [Acerihabitans arboris]
MRRDEREITQPSAIAAILASAKVMYIALAENDIPFMVPVFYAWDGTSLYFHSARAGTKIEMLKRNSTLCFAVSTEQGVVEDEVICNFEARHRTVIGLGNAVFIQDEAEKIAALNLIVARFSDKAWTFPAANVRATLVLRIDIISMKGKQHGF